ncbi:Hypothetical predicted protein [Podarcis lilfordi]|uniref:Uncharacterized protein n=1 Tax=Podarcis lilfordi TaxID=74358 RepID=A0AA35PPG6_9SAUR|nr:Hypothetical predicted protein [Podarcis lilfordi]
MALSMEKILLNTPLTVGIMQQLLDEQSKELRTEINKMVNENVSEKGQIKGDMELLGNNTDKNLPEHESGMVKWEAADDEMGLQTGAWRSETVKKWSCDSGRLE